MSRDLTHWEAYYRGGVLVSCPMGRGDGYDREIREVWEAYFRELPDGARIVDLCTGNGALALIAREVAEVTLQSFEIHGVDLAQIDPIKHVADGASRFAGVTFHAGVSAEKLPFEAASLTAVCSQYGIEYSDLTKSLAEVARVLAPGGHALFVTHHAESIAVEKARITLAVGARVLDELALFELTRAYVRAEREDPARARSLHAELSARSATLRAEVASSTEPLFANITLTGLARLFEQRTRGTLDEVIRELDAMDRAMREWLQRLRDLLGAAWAPADIDRMTRLAREAGLQVVLVQPQMHDGKQLVGWRVRLHKP